MFAIYTPSGRSFLGPLEQLRKIEQIDKTQASRGAVEQDNPPAQYRVSQQAASQYQAQLRQHGEREAVQHAYQIMSRHVQVLHRHAPLLEAARKFEQFAYQLFPILDDEQQLCGALSRERFYRALLFDDAKQRYASHTIGEQFLGDESRVYAADPITDVRRIATLLVEKHLDALPIIEASGRLVGLVSRTDILRSAIADPPLSLWC